MDLSNALAVLMLIAFIVFVVWLMIKRDRAKLQMEVNLPEFSVNVHKMSPSRKLKMLTDNLHELESRRLVPDQAKISAVRDRAQELLQISIKAEFLYQNELLQCFNAIAWIEESKTTHIRCDPPDIHIAFPFATDVARATKLASRPVNLWRDQSKPKDRLQQKASWIKQPSLPPSLPVVDQWLRCMVWEFTAWLNFVSDIVEQYVWPAAVHLTDYTWLIKEAVDLAHRFVYVTTRVNLDTDQTTITLDFMVPADVVRRGAPIVAVATGRLWRLSQGLCCIPIKYEKPPKPPKRPKSPKRFNFLNVVARGIQSGY